MSYLCTRVHLIWSTLHREPSIDKEWQPRLHGYMRGILENHHAKVFAIGGIADHVHLYCSLPATMSIAQSGIDRKEQFHILDARELFETLCLAGRICGLHDGKVRG